MTLGLPRHLLGPVCFVLMLFHSASGISGGPALPRFIAVVDAGSSGSRIYLYDAGQPGKARHAKVLMEFESDAPGLSSFKDTPAEAGAKGLAPLLQRLSDFLPSQNIPKTAVTIDVIATGGMRMLDSHVQESIFDSVRKFIQENAFTAGSVETITGAMEGVYSWVDVNYLLANFEDKRSTVGVVEIGGASAQIAFETTTSTALSETVIIGQRKHYVFVESFLGLGRNEARKRMVQTSGSAQGAGVCYPRGLHVDDQKAGAKGLIGDFNDEACARSYESVLANFEIRGLQSQLRSKPGSFAAVGAGNPVGTVWGLLEAWKSASTNPYEISEKARAGCNKPWSDFEAQYGGAMFNKTQCADSVFVSLFLYGESGLHLNDAAVKSYKTIDGETPTWTRGFVMLKYLE